MNPKYKKVYCCTPVAFHANEHFFIRDTGLISVTLRGMGIESKCIMPLPYYEDDICEHLIRTEYCNLESVEWWKNLGMDALVLYSWGAPRYRKIARAVHKAGIRLHIHMDFDGELGPRYGWPFFARLKNILVNLFRSIHLGYADVISCAPIARESFRKHWMYGKMIFDKTVIMPAPVAPHFRVDSSSKKTQKVVCVGRWTDDEEDAVKRPEYMIRAAGAIAELNPDVEVDIYGRVGDTVKNIYNHFHSSIKARVNLRGYVYNRDLPKIYNGALVSICTSLSESIHIASAEAMCCGCSIVVPPRRTLQVLHWYTTHESGSVAESDTPESLALAVTKELGLWNNNKRNPEEIARYWQNIFHADMAMSRIFQTDNIICPTYFA